MPEIRPSKSASATQQKGKGAAKSAAPQGNGAPRPGTYVNWASAEREVKYPEFTVGKYLLDKAIKADQAQRMLGWETEKDYVARMLKLPENRGRKAAEFEFGEDYLLKVPEKLDQAGQKVRCWNNAKNRPFDEKHCRKLAWVVLMRQWAGPTTMPGKTVNGETICIGRTKLVLSGQHRLIALVLAHLMWKADKPGGKWKALWPEDQYPDGPVLESVVCFGVSEDQEVVNTLDNVKPRTPSDIFYTSDLFALYSPDQRKMASSHLQAAVSFLWRRTRYGGGEGDVGQRYASNPEIMSFVELHGGEKGRLIEAVKHVVDWNYKERKISGLLGLSPGAAAGMLYLMGSSATDGEEFRKQLAAGQEPSFDWRNWDLAVKFWQELSERGSQLDPAREALCRLADPETGSGKRDPVEQACLIAKTWESYLGAGGKAKKMQFPIRLKYDRGEYGENLLNEFPTFEGIDLGEPRRREGQNGEALTPEEVEQRLKESRAQATKKAQEKIETAGKGPKAKGRDQAAKDPTTAPLPPAESLPRPGGTAQRFATPKELVDSLRKAHPGKVLFFPTSRGEVALWGADAVLVAKMQNRKATPHGDGLARYAFPKTSSDLVAGMLMDMGHKVAVCEDKGADGIEVHDLEFEEHGEGDPPTEAEGEEESGGGEGDEVDEAEDREDEDEPADE